MPKVKHSKPAPVLSSSDEMPISEVEVLSVPVPPQQQVAAISIAIASLVSTMDLVLQRLPQAVNPTSNLQEENPRPRGRPRTKSNTRETRPHTKRTRHLSAHYADTSPDVSIKRTPSPLPCRRPSSPLPSTSVQPPTVCKPTNDSAAVLALFQRFLHKL